MFAEDEDGRQHHVYHFRMDLCVFMRFETEKKEEKQHQHQQNEKK